MKYFCDINDIDFRFINEHKDVEYYYDGHNSPIHLLDLIKNNLQ